MAARDLAAPATLAGRYRSLFVVGRGGMGSVEAALELGAADYERVVALKRLLPDAARDGRRIEMFLREAKLAAMLEHPNVVRAFDYGEAAGELYLAMEYVEGQPLSVVLRTLANHGERLESGIVAYVLAEICEGLHAAHELKGDKGQPLSVVHRDVSPQNVMLGYDGRVRLLDFGVAKIEAENVTKTGEVKGKTAYMSPEQAMGDTIDRRSDLFGVGAVLFECLTLRRMWGDGTDMEVIRKLALEEPPPLPDDAPPELRALYKRLVARDPAARPATARDAATALRPLCPEGKARELEQLLAKHFAAEAEAQRRKLEAALEEVAPDQAEELRGSVVPASGRAPPRETSAPSPRPRWALPVLLAIVAAGGGVAFWRASATAQKPAPEQPRPVVEKAIAPSAPHEPEPPRPGAETIPVSLQPSAPQPSATQKLVVAPSKPARPAAAAAPAPPNATGPTPSTGAAPPRAKPPLDVDDHPF